MFYAAVAVTSLFTNVLVHPSDRETRKDAKLLDSAVDIMRAVPLQMPSQEEREHVHQMVAFASELARLAALVVDRAPAHTPGHA